MRYREETNDTHLEEAASGPRRADLLVAGWGASMAAGRGGLGGHLPCTALAAGKQHVLLDPKGPLVTPRALSWPSLLNQDEFRLAWAGSTGRALPDGVGTASGQLHLVLLNCL